MNPPKRMAGTMMVPLNQRTQRIIHSIRGMTTGMTAPPQKSHPIKIMWMKMMIKHILLPADRRMF